MHVTTQTKKFKKTIPTVLTSNMEASQFRIVPSLNDAWTCNIFFPRMDDREKTISLILAVLIPVLSVLLLPFPFVHSSFISCSLCHASQDALSPPLLLPPSEEEAFEDSSFLGHGFYLPLSVWRRQQGGQFGVEIKGQESE